MTRRIIYKKVLSEFWLMFHLHPTGRKRALID
jgi:hypothetical protein